MRKILFILFAAFAFVACDKENTGVRDVPGVGDKSYIECKLEPQSVTIPAEGGTFTVKSNIPTHIVSCGFSASKNSSMDLAFGTGSKSIPIAFPYIYEPKHPSLPYGPDFEIFKGSYYIEQIDATTFNIAITPPAGYDGISFAFFPIGGMYYGQSLNVVVK